MRHRIRFFQQLAVLARAGVPLRTSLQRLRERIPGREMAVLIAQIEAGERVGDAFARAGFSPFECNLVNAGERSGRLEIVFQHLADFWELQRQMFQALAGQLYYPLAVMHLAIFVGALMELVFNPWIVVVIHLVETLGFLYAIAFAFYMVIKVSWPSDAAQSFWLSLPIIGRTLSTAYAYRWITALRLEYSSGIPLPDAVADAWRASGYAGRDHLAEEGRLALLEGSELTPLIQRWRQLPRDWIDFIETGEISGALETALENLEDEAGRAWRVAQQRMTDWMPKILYFLILLVVAAQILFSVKNLYDKEVSGPMDEVNKVLNGEQ